MILQGSWRYRTVAGTSQQRRACATGGALPVPRAPTARRRAGGGRLLSQLPGGPGNYGAGKSSSKFRVIDPSIYMCIIYIYIYI